MLEAYTNLNSNPRTHLFLPVVAVVRVEVFKTRQRFGQASLRRVAWRRALRLKLSTYGGYSSRARALISPILESALVELWSLVPCLLPGEKVGALELETVGKEGPIELRATGWSTDEGVYTIF